MKISVVIPVYNAEKYVESAVESALQQKECGEVILVEDQSPDNALEVCKALARRYDKVKLYQHEDGKNHGAGISRNLGIKKARYDFVAFLDADDFYLPNRFAKAEKILSQDSSIDGVYEAVGCEFENEEAKRRYFATHGREIATITEPVKPDKLFYCMMSGKYGHIHLNGFVGKKEALLKVEMFPALRLHQDMVFFVKLAAMCKLVPGEIEKPVALRRLHLNNRITNLNTDFTETTFRAREYLVNWMENSDIDYSKLKLVKTRYYRQKYSIYKKRRRYFLAILFYFYYQMFFKRNEPVLANPSLAIS
jgi:glycosyltransferase involved in cell wall biosynthesis